MCSFKNPNNKKQHQKNTTSKKLKKTPAKKHENQDLFLQEALGWPDLWGRTPVHLAAEGDAGEVLQAAAGRGLKRIFLSFWSVCFFVPRIFCFVSKEFVLKVFLRFLNVF